MSIIFIIIFVAPKCRLNGTVSSMRDYIQFSASKGQPNFQKVGIINEVSPMKGVSYLASGPASQFTIRTSLFAFSATVGDIKFVCPTSYRHAIDDVGYCFDCAMAAQLKCTATAKISVPKGVVDVLITTPATFHLLEATADDMQNMSEVRLEI